MHVKYTDKVVNLENETEPLSLEISLLLRTRLTGESLLKSRPHLTDILQSSYLKTGCVHSVNQYWSHSGSSVYVHLYSHWCCE